MSEGGRRRASLEVEVGKASHKCSVQRSAVRSIAWLGLVGFLHLTFQRNTAKRTKPKLLWYRKACAGLRNGHADSSAAVRTTNAIKPIQRGPKKENEGNNGDRPQAILRLRQEYASEKHGK